MKSSRAWFKTKMINRRLFFSPMQFPTQSQWWSNVATQFRHNLQCFARRGISTTHSPQKPSNIEVSSATLLTPNCFVSGGALPFGVNTSFVFLGEAETRKLYWSPWAVDFFPSLLILGVVEETFRLSKNIGLLSI